MVHTSSKSGAALHPGTGEKYSDILDYTARPSPQNGHVRAVVLKWGPCLEASLIIVTERRGATCIWWVEARNPAK